jgi:hypothetical protein
VTGGSRGARCRLRDFLAKPNSRISQHLAARNGRPMSRTICGFWAKVP